MEQCQAKIVALAILDLVEQLANVNVRLVTVEILVRLVSHLLILNDTSYEG